LRELDAPFLCAMVTASFYLDPEVSRC